MKKDLKLSLDRICWLHTRHRSHTVYISSVCCCYYILIRLIYILVFLFFYSITQHSSICFLLSIHFVCLLVASCCFWIKCAVEHRIHVVQTSLCSPTTFFLRTRYMAQLKKAKQLLIVVTVRNNSLRHAPAASKKKIKTIRERESLLFFVVVVPSV